MVLQQPLTHFMPPVFRYPVKTSENQRFSDVFRGYRKRPVAEIGLMVVLKLSNHSLFSKSYGRLWVKIG